jgi:trk/ktr system potassium uptake protein
MKALIMGCGRVGAELAATLEAEGHDITVLDTDSYSFRRLPATFRGRKVVGNGVDIERLKSVGIDEMDAFAACTQGDNRNIMAARHLFNVPKVVCRIYDPLREEIYKTLGIETVSPTIVGARLMREALEGGAGD